MAISTTQKKKKNMFITGSFLSTSTGHVREFKSSPRQNQKLLVTIVTSSDALVTSSSALVTSSDSKKKITPEAFHLHLCEDLPLLPGQLLFVEPRGVQLLELLPQKDHTNRDSTRSNS